MTYRNGTYVAFDGNDTTDPTKSDLKYYGLLQSWNSQKQYNFSFSDSHKKTYAVKDTSSTDTLKSRLMERMRNSKNVLLIISEDTNWNRGLLNYEIEKAVDFYKLPIIITYPKYNAILNPILLKDTWTKALSDRIFNSQAKCIHIPFIKNVIIDAISQFTVHNNKLTGSLEYYSEDSYKSWGLI